MQEFDWESRQQADEEEVEKYKFKKNHEDPIVIQKCEKDLVERATTEQKKQG